MEAMTWDEVKVGARNELRNRKLPDVYSKRLEFELSEIEKQGAIYQWQTIVSEEQRFDSNPNCLLLPWLYNCVEQDPIASRTDEMVTTAKYQHLVKYMQQHGKLPCDIIQDSDKPDIDIDCLPEARDEIKKYAIDTYSAGIDDGYGAVCSVSTWMTYLLRSAIQDVAESTHCLGEGWCSKKEATILTKELPDEVDELKDNGASPCKGCKTVHTLAQCPNCKSPDTENPTIGKLLAEQPVLRKFYEQYPKVIDLAVRLVGRIRQMGKHAGALIIADRPLYGNLPMYRRSSNSEEGEGDQWISLWTEGRNPQLSKFNYTKWDILGLKNLRYIYECCKMIEANHGISFGKNMEGWCDINPEVDRAGYYIDADGNRVDISLNDEGALSLANARKTDAVFQFDTDLAKRILKDGVRHFYDLMIFNAMGHPGPMAMIPDYVERRDDAHEKWKALDDARITEVLGETYNTIVYQEQLQALWQALAGFTSPEAQEARKAVAKKWRDKLKPIKEKWLKGASKTIGEKAALEWWDKMETFGRYAFNRSHSVAYCLVAFQCLWLKAHFPHEWWASVMSWCKGDHLIRFMNVSRGEGILYRPLDLNNLTARFGAKVQPVRRHDEGERSDDEGWHQRDTSLDHVTPGLLGIKGIGESVIATYAKPGEFTSLKQFIEERGKNKTLIERLIKLGVCRHLPGHENMRATWVWYLYNYCSGPEIKTLKEKLQPHLLALDGWNEATIKAERERQIAAYKAAFPKRNKIPAKHEKWAPKVVASLENIAKLITEDFTIQEILAAEELFLGYTIHSPLDQFVTTGGKMIQDAKDKTADVGWGEIEAMILSVEMGETKTKRPMCRIQITDGKEVARLILWDDNLQGQDKSVLKKNVGIRARLVWDDERKNFTIKRGGVLMKLAKRPKEEKQTARAACN